VNNLEQEGRAQAIDRDELGDLRHIAAVGRLVKDDVDVLGCGAHGTAVADIGVVELRRTWHPGRLALATTGRWGISRWRFLRVAAGAAAATGLVGVGVAADEVQRQLRQPHALVAGPGRWYDVAGATELTSGQMKAFAAGGILGYLINEGGRLHAVSAICTHMGCRLKPVQGRLGLRCLCHGSQFSADGRVLTGVAPDPLPHIAVRVEGGRVYALGTTEDI
jgi:nitrite reductase/ring-hydroxylating ferredoxin subunit